MRRAAGEASEVTAPLLSERQRPVYDADITRHMDLNMADLLKRPDDAIGFIETCGVMKIGEMEIDDYVAIRAFQDANLLTCGHDEREIDWKGFWLRHLDKYRQKGELAESGWQDMVTIEAHVVSIRNAAGPPGEGMLQPILLRWQSRACPLTVFALPAVQAVVMYKWDQWASRFLQYEFVLYLFWLISYTAFIILFQNEDLSLGYGDIWENSFTGKAKIILNLLSVVFMSPFLLIEGNTMLDYGFNWFSMWNLLDIVTYTIQFITCIVYISREGIEQEWFSVLMAVQVIFLFAKVQYFSRVFASAKSSLVDTLKVVISDVKWFLLFILLTLFSFALAFHILFRNSDTAKEFSEVWHSIVTMFSFMLGGFDTNIFYENHDPDPIISVAFFVTYEAVMAIMLLNLLIAIMTDSYSKVMEDEHLWNLCSKAQIIDELETTMPSWLIRKWNPTYVHILKLGPKKAVNLDSLWDRLDLTETRLVSTSKEMTLKINDMERKILRRLEFLSSELEVLEEYKDKGTVAGRPTSNTLQRVNEVSE